MAYGDYGAFVYRDGERAFDREDATPFKEKHIEPGYHQAFMKSEGANPHHAVLGSKGLRWCGHKTSPVLFVSGMETSIEQYEVEEDEWSGEFGGDDFYAFINEHGRLELELTELDGTQWYAECGYMFGAGHID